MVASSIRILGYDILVNIFLFILEYVLLGSKSFAIVTCALTVLNIALTSWYSSQILCIYTVECHDSTPPPFGLHLLTQGHFYLAYKRVFLQPFEMKPLF